MSMTDHSTGTATAVRGTATDDFREKRPLSETRLFARTSEFWAMVAGIVAIAVIYNSADDASLNLWRACLLGTLVGVSYIVSRGIAKAGSHHDGYRSGRGSSR